MQQTKRKKKTSQAFLMELDLIDQVTKSKHKNASICVICRGTIDSALKRLGCTHKFHMTCFQQYEMNNYKCPVCLKAFKDPPKPSDRCTCEDQNNHKCWKRKEATKKNLKSLLVNYFGPKKTDPPKKPE